MSELQLFFFFFALVVPPNLTLDYNSNDTTVRAGYRKVSCFKCVCVVDSHDPLSLQLYLSFFFFLPPPEAQVFILGVLDAFQNSPGSLARFSLASILCHCHRHDRLWGEMASSHSILSCYCTVSPPRDSTFHFFLTPFVGFFALFDFLTVVIPIVEL